MPTTAAEQQQQQQQQRTEWSTIRLQTRRMIHRLQSFLRACDFAAMTASVTCGAAKICLQRSGDGSCSSVAMTVELPLSELSRALKLLEADAIPRARSASPTSPWRREAELPRLGRESPSPERASLREAFACDPFEQTEVWDQPLFAATASICLQFWVESPPSTDPQLLSGTRRGQMADLPSAQEDKAEPLTLPAHSSWVNGVAWASDGQRIITGSSQHTACIYQQSPGCSSWKIVKTLRAGCKDGFGAVAWSPDCSRVAAAGADNDARVYLLSASEYRQWEAPSLLKGHSDVVRAVSWSPCGRKVLTGGDDKKAIIWKASRSDPKSWEQFSELDQHSDAVRAVAWCPNADKATIATGSEDSTIIIWQPAKESGGDRRKFELVAILRHTAGIRALAWTIDGNHFASGCKDATVRIWDCAQSDARSWPELSTLKMGNAASVDAVAWSPDGSRIATGGADAVVRVSDAVAVASAFLLFLLRYL
eukprot:s3116_g2.t2